MPDHKTDVDRELSDIRREVIESRNLVIKTDNLLKNLHAELKMVGKRQEDFQKRQWVSSAVAYALFVILCVVGSGWIISARSSASSQERDRLQKSVAELTQKLDKAKADETASVSASRAAAEVYRMMTTLPGDERLKGVDALVKLDTGRLTPLEKQALNDRSELLRVEIGQNAFERGKAASRRNEFSEAVKHLSRFLAMNPSAGDSLDAAFWLGHAHHQLRQHDQAIPQLSRFITEDRRSRNRDYAMLMLAQSYESTGQFEKALELARDAIAHYPNSQWLGGLKARLFASKRALAGAGANGQAAGAAPAAGTVPAAGAPAGAPATAATNPPAAPPAQ